MSPAAFVVEFYHLEVAYTAVHCVSWQRTEKSQRTHGNPKKRPWQPQKLREKKRSDGHSLVGVFFGQLPVSSMKTWQNLGFN